MSTDEIRTEPSLARFVDDALAARWPASVPPEHRSVLEKCFGQSSLKEADLATLYTFVGLERPRRVVEVGLAYGSSAVCNLLAASDSIVDYVIIDPFQRSNFRNRGLDMVRESATGMMNVSFLETFSYLALPKLLLDGRTFDYAFVDASHMFDATLIEFFYIDQMLSDGGTVIMDDRPWPMVGAVVDFIRKNYVHYAVDTRHPRLSFFRKKYKDQRRWYDWRPFEVPRSGGWEARIAHYQKERGTAFAADPHETDPRATDDRRA
jgi:predicted O-methyltransferase YrrM